MLEIIADIMLKLLFSSILVCLSLTFANAQSSFTWVEWPDMPKPVTNNAVAGVIVNDTAFVYSFSGIDTTKSPEGIHNECFKLNTESLEWQSIPPLPDGPGRIAAGASEVNGIIYIIGGYEVLPNFNEVSLNYLHRFDPFIDDYLADGEPIPIPIDDHVQVVWKDSLLYVITGWSNNGNVSAVQVYNTYTDAWSAGTPIPSTNAYRAFGASGAIVGDTIYYSGGATGFSFNATSNLRKGVINPDNPLEIEWSVVGQNPGDAGYRMASMAINENVFWIGGSGVTYNFDGIAYNGSGGVEPLNRILEYRTTNDSWYETESPYGIMDLRGIASIGDNRYVLCGGMGAGQQVQSKTYLLQYFADPLLVENHAEELCSVYPNPALERCYVESMVPLQQIELYNFLGNRIKIINGRNSKRLEISLEEIPTGIYFIRCSNLLDQTSVLRLVKF